MRHKFYFGLLLIFFSLNTNLFAQNFWVPDSNFRAKLKQIYPTCFTAQDSLYSTSFQIRYATTLDVNFSSISSLDGIQFFTYLSKLYCNYNQLTTLPALPAYLTELHCFYNQLTSLPALPGTLARLDCSWNQLTSLPVLPITLEYLDCSANQISNLPVLPASLLDLFCMRNQLSSLPSLPPFLERIYCRYNQLTSLPGLPLSLVYLLCEHNQLSSLPEIPGSIYMLKCQNNPITCFPKIRHILFSSFINGIFIDSTLINCIPNQGTFPLSVVQSSQPMPICAPSNTSCNYNFTLGYVFLDVNGNGSKDNLELGLEFPVYYSGNSGVFPNNSGFFNAASDTGVIGFQVAMPLYYTATTPSAQTIQVVSGVVDTLYFGLQPIGGINDLKIDLNPIGFLRPGFEAKYLLQYQNVGTDTLNNVQVKFLKPSQLSNLFALPTASSVSGDTLIWNIASLNPLQQGNAVITDSVFSSAVLGDTAIAYAWIEPLVGDTTPSNNTSISNSIIQGAFDPNDKSVSAKFVLPNTADYLDYRVRFQNTGTDTAFTVTVMDTLSTLLDISSMQMISASHKYELSIINRIAKWIFINILLPDSNTNEADSHGFLKFRIKPLPGLTVTDSIPNKADIYYDYNTAITTNTIVVNVLNPLQVKDLQETDLQVYPNPVQESLRIVNQHAGPLGKIELMNANGKVLETKTISSSTYTWNLLQLPAGTYILKGQGWGQKVVKE